MMYEPFSCWIPCAQCTEQKKLVLLIGYIYRFGYSSPFQVIAKSTCSTYIKHSSHAWTENTVRTPHACTERIADHTQLRYRAGLIFFFAEINLNYRGLATAAALATLKGLMLSRLVKIKGEAIALRRATSLISVQGMSDICNHVMSSLVSKPLLVQS